MKLTLILFLLIASGLVLGLHRQSELRRFRQVNRDLMELAVEARQLAQENARLQHLDFDPAELDRLRPVRAELARARAQVTELRQISQLDPEQTRAEIEAALEATARLEHEADLMEARRRQLELKPAIRYAFNTLADICRVLANEASGRYPTSFTELEAALAAISEDPSEPGQAAARSPRSDAREEWNRLIRTIENEDQIASLRDHIEFVPRTRPLTTSDQPALLLREREPRYSPGEGWVRFYATSNGVTEEVILPENHFADWERAIQAHLSNELRGLGAD